MKFIRIIEIKGYNGRWHYIGATADDDRRELIISRGRLTDADALALVDKGTEIDLQRTSADPQTIMRRNN